MKNLILAFAIGLFLFSCTSNNSKTASNHAEEHATIMIPETSCYAYVSNKDTFLLKLEVFPNVVTGVLKYNFFEKDKSQGTIDGKLVGDTIFADYTFTSEGTESIREVAFLLTGNNVTEGFGEMTEQNRKMIFKDPENINFTNGIQFNPVDCVENDIKFQLNH